MTASVNPDDVDISAKSKEKDEALYLKSMDSLMDELCAPFAIQCTCRQLIYPLMGTSSYMVDISIKIALQQVLVLQPLVVDQQQQVQVVALQVKVI
jgi:hypothetical protein